MHIRRAIYKVTIMYEARECTETINVRWLLLFTVEWKDDLFSLYIALH